MFFDEIIGQNGLPEEMSVVCPICNHREAVKLVEFTSPSFLMPGEKVEDYIKVFMANFTKKEMICPECGTGSYIAQKDWKKVEEKLKAVLSRR
jgi:hypothetical protein